MRSRTLGPRGSAVLFAALMLSACGGGNDGARYQTSDASVTTPDAGEVETACSGQDDGTACGTDLHCETEQCVPDRCGDGLVNGREGCDDGNELKGDGCSPECRPESGCGNGKLDEGEECDDGNWVEFDACTNRCQLQRCGNGRRELDEECDDGNAVDGDGCSNACLVQACRNGRVEPGEECDDGNQVDQGDGCTNSCQTSICGNGKVEKYEDCDDGNRVDEDACANNCIRAVCGDGVIQAGEACETGYHRLAKMGSGAATRAEHQACTSDCKGWTREDPCIQCQDRLCSAIVGDTNLVSGCTSEIDPSFGADPEDPTFLEACIDAVECGIQKRCFDATDPSSSGLGCYCGTSTDQCSASGPLPSAPCRTQWELAARSDQLATVMGNISDLQHPAAWAFLLLTCYQDTRRQFCSAECADQRRIEPAANPEASVSGSIWP